MNLENYASYLPHLDELVMDEEVEARNVIAEMEDAEERQLAAELHYISVALRECVISIRNSGTLTSECQRLLEFLGVNPSRVLFDIGEYVKVEVSSEAYSATALYQFVDTYSRHLQPVIKIKKEYVESLVKKED